MKIFLADANRDSRLGMQMLLEHEPGIRVVGITVRSQGLVGQVGAAQAVVTREGVAYEVAAATEDEAAYEAGVATEGGAAIVDAYAKAEDEEPEGEASGEEEGAE